MACCIRNFWLITMDINLSVPVIMVWKYANKDCVLCQLAALYSWKFSNEFHFIILIEATIQLYFFPTTQFYLVRWILQLQSCFPESSLLIFTNVSPNDNRWGVAYPMHVGENGISMIVIEDAFATVAVSQSVLFNLSLSLSLWWEYFIKFMVHSFMFWMNSFKLFSAISNLILIWRLGTFYFAKNWQNYN